MHDMDAKGSMTCVLPGRSEYLHNLEDVQIDQLLRYPPIPGCLFESGNASLSGRCKDSVFQEGNTFGYSNDKSVNLA